MPSTPATAIRTIVVLVVVWAMVRSILFLVLSGVGTGAAWFAYFRALQLGPASRVAPVDKLSLPFTILLATVLENHSTA